MSQRFAFDWDAAYRVAGLPFGITPWTAYAEVSPTALRVRYGPWSLRTALSNITSATRTGGYTFVKTAGPPHLSFSDRGVSFATNGRAGVCVRFDRPVPAIDPTKRIVHPGATLTVADREGFAEALGVSLGG
ncbi:hypothetical protein [Nocardioides marmoribigeumensis]|uniref:Uncharacterized protein n=1 Tax=Nocardioides marmoribigeumensis TaxID=433649 RepID=A0ABU2BYL9_9ACTN|nr:hypothetical protein [Nocardioides marmoribigeumensis]MDR7363474.1 hypothetical protein [Nocardioides marmoribigeumensis]